MSSFKIVGCGAYLPSKIFTNTDLTSFIDTTDEWIQSRTGIEQRHVSSAQELNADMGFYAAKQAIKNAAIGKEEIELVVVCTTTPDSIFPSVASKIQGMLGLSSIPSFDLQAVCSGFIYGMHVVDAMIKAHKYKTVLLICSEKMSSILDWQDRKTSVLFGDGAGAIILQQKNDDNLSIPASGVIDSIIHSDGSLSEILHTQKIEDLSAKNAWLIEHMPDVKSSGQYIEMLGQEVFKHATNKMASSIEEILFKNDLTIADIDFIIPHQANLRIINKLAEKFDIPEHKMIISIKEHANCSAASIPLALYKLYNSGSIKTGNVILFVAFGAGATWGSVLFRW